jgi:hypothetical protein
MYTGHDIPSGSGGTAIHTLPQEVTLWVDILRLTYCVNPALCGAFFAASF